LDVSDCASRSLKKGFGRLRCAAVTAGSPREKHIESLRYTQQVIQEAMRLYPPASTFNGNRFDLPRLRYRASISLSS
jgi:hypothetical protein